MKNQENLCASIPYVDKKVSRIFAGTAFSPIQDGADGTDFFEAALANGINAFDTARVYMEAEHSFGNWLEKSGRGSHSQQMRPSGCHVEQTGE